MVDNDVQNICYIARNVNSAILLVAIVLTN